MTLKELADSIYALLPEDQEKPALVYPPTGCPSNDFVPVDCVDKTVHGTPVIKTGKTPLTTQ